MSSNIVTPALPISQQVVHLFWRMRWHVARAVWHA